MDEISRRTWWLLSAVAMASVVVATAYYAGSLGFWEPYESATLHAAMGDVQPVEDDTDDAENEASDDADEPDDAERIDTEAIATIDGAPANVSWLKTTWAEQFVDDTPVIETGDVGEVERRMRLPALLLLVLLIGAAALWARDHLGEGPAAMTVVVIATSPIAFVGTVVLSSPWIYAAATALAVIAFFQSIYGDKRRLLWAVIAAVGLAVVALDERLIGVFAAMAAVVGLAVAQAIDHRFVDPEQGEPAKFDLPWGIGAVGVAVAAIAYGWFQSRGIDQGGFREDIAQLLWVFVPAVVLVGFAVGARKTAVGRGLFDLRGLLFAAGGIIPLVVLGSLYAGAVPVDPEAAEAASPALAFLLENDVLFDADTAQMSFAWWLRQIGFGLLPHVIWLVPALGFLNWKLGRDDLDEATRSVAALCLIWPVASFVVVAPAASLGHTAFPAFFPLMVAVGWMIGDGAFWRQVRQNPGAYLLVALVALFVLMILSGDLEEFPARLVGFGLGGAEDPEVFEEFAYGSGLEWWFRAMMAGVVLYFAGAISWLVFAAGDAKRFWRWLRGLVERLRNDDDADDGEDLEDADDPAQGDVFETGKRRMADREAWRDEDSPLSSIAARLERLPGLVGLVLFAGAGFAAVYYATIVDELDELLSTRAVVEQYLAAADDTEQLRAYRIDEDEWGFYVRGLDEVSGLRDFSRAFGEDDRLFVLIPRDQLPHVNNRTRRDHDQNTPMLATGGGLYLTTNQLADERNVNPVADYVLNEVDDDYTPLEFEVDGEMRPVEFDEQIEFLGYRLDRPHDDGPAVYAWGENMEITMYFKVHRRVPRSQEIFMHIDFTGHRLHGDHDPVRGNYPTNHWLPGDVIKDVHEVEIERFSPPGMYTMWMGFYRGDDRMNVSPDEAHDGDDRVEMGRIRVVPFRL